MPVKLNSPAGGSVTLDVPNYLTTANTLYLPAVASGNVVTTSDSNTITQTMISRSGFYGGFGPAFYVYQSAGQSLPASATKVTFNTVVFDTNNCYNTTTYRFTPNVAGYYWFNIAVFTNAGSSSRHGCLIYKNGADSISGYMNGSTDGSGNNAKVNGLVYMNGSTDYVEAYYTQSTAGSLTSNPASNLTYFQGFLVRPL